VALLWPQLILLNLLSLINDKSNLPLQGIYNILIIDDAIYSGNNTISKIDNFIYQLASSLNLNSRDIGTYFKFHIVIPFITLKGVKNIHSYCSRFNTHCYFYSVLTLPLLPDLINLKDYYPIDTDNILYHKFGIEQIALPPVYFDHKVAGPFSTFSTIYFDGRLPNGSLFGFLFKVKPSREKIVQLGLLYQLWSQQ